MESERRSDSQHLPLLLCSLQDHARLCHPCPAKVEYNQLAFNKGLDLYLVPFWKRDLPLQCCVQAADTDEVGQAIMTQSK